MVRKNKDWTRGRWRLVFAVGLFFYSLTIGLAMAQPLSFPNVGKNGAGGGRCSDITVEARVDMNADSTVMDRLERVIDFTITVFVTNQCREPLRLQPESLISYQTNFPAMLSDTTQPPECLSQQSSFSGLVPPLQKVPFTLRAQGCAFPLSTTESPRVTLETGTVITDKGEKLIPTVTEFLQ